MIAHTHGTQLIMFSFLNGSDWLDPSKFRTMFDVCNTHADMANKLRPIGGPWSFSKNENFSWWSDLGRY